jgi:hypothetical protein
LGSDGMSKGWSVDRNNKFKHWTYYLQFLCSDLSYAAHVFVDTLQYTITNIFTKA